MAVGPAIPAKPKLVVPVSASYCEAEPLLLIADLSGLEEAWGFALAAPDEGRGAAEAPKRAAAKSSLSELADDGGGTSFRSA